MNTPDMNIFEQRLVEALHQEAGLAMTLTDTPRELRRWRDNQHKRRNRTRIIAVVATAAAAAALILGLTKLGGTTSHRNEPIHKPSTVQQHQTSIETVQPLPASVRSTVLHGPGTVDTLAFGAVWGINISPHPRYLYRMSLDGSHVLGRTDLRKYLGDPMPVFRIGSALFVPAANGPGREGYVVLDRAGRQTGFVKASSAGVGGGDSSGGWVQTDIDRLAQVDRTGRPTGKQVRLPNESISSIATGAGSLWVSSITDGVYRLDPGTGKVTGKFHAPAGAVQLAVTDSAVYVATDHYQLVRVDPTSLHITAVSDNHVSPGAYDEIALGADGSLWVAPDQRGVVELDPDTLDVVQSMQIGKASRAGGNYGLGLTAGRMFVGDGDNDRVVSFPVH